MATQAERDRDFLYDYAVDHPDGWTINDAVAALGIPMTRGRKAVNAIRQTLGEDEINLICEPQGSLDPWLYRLVGTYDDAEGWALGRVTDAESRLKTVLAVVQAVSIRTDGRTVEGRKARVIRRQVERLVEDLAEIDSDR